MPRLKAAQASTGVYEKVKGSGVWYVRYRMNGKQVFKKIGTHSAAVAYYSKVKTLIHTGEGYVPTTAKETAKTEKQLRESRTGVTVSELCDDLLAHIRSLPDEYRDQRNPPVRIERIRAAFGERIADSVKSHEISDWLNSITKRTPGKRRSGVHELGRETAQKASAATFNRLKATMSSMYKLGKHRDKVSTNPARDFKQRTVSGGVIRYLLPDEERRLRSVLEQGMLACGPQNEQQRKRVLHRICELDIALGTGMRQGEQYGLRWSDVDLDREVLILRQTKNGKAREVHLIADVVTAFKRLKDLNLALPKSVPDAVFCVTDPKKWWKTALKAANIQDFRWHDLRHTFCSRLAQSGASLKVIQEAAGHQTIEMSARYAHLDKTTLRNAMAVLNRPAA